MRRRPVFAAALLVTALVVDGLVQSHAASAAPYPGKDDVRRAHQAESGAKAEVAGIEKQLAAAAAASDAADVALSTAAENYDVAVLKLKSAKLEATQAQQVADNAGRRLDAAQVQVGRLAAATYREGGPIAELDVLLSPGGPDAVLERATLLRTVATERDRTVHSMDSARVSATSLQRQADLAMKRQQEAAKQLAAARAQAQASSDAARASVASTKATQQILLTKLAKARRTTVAVEKARQAGLEAAARQRAEVRARREAAARAAQQNNSNADSNGNVGNGNGGNGNGGNGNGGNGNGGTGNGGGNAGSEPGPATGGSSGSAGGGETAVAWARRRIGLPYLWGGDGPNSYDCSGLTMRAWQQAGVYLPHSSRMQYQQVEKISYDSLRPGDLIFYATNTGDAGTIHHVTLYAGGGMMIEAPYTGANVRLVELRRGGSMPYAGRP